MTGFRAATLRTFFFAIHAGAKELSSSAAILNYQPIKISRTSLQMSRFDTIVEFLVLSQF